MGIANIGIGLETECYGVLEKISKAHYYRCNLKANRGVLIKFTSMQCPNLMLLN